MQNVFQTICTDVHNAIYNKDAKIKDGFPHGSERGGGGGGGVKSMIYVQKGERIGTRCWQRENANVLFGIMSKDAHNVEGGVRR